MRSRRTHLGVIFLVACGLRLGFSTIPALSDTLLDPYSRLLHYLEVAHNVRAGRGLVMDSAKMKAVMHDWEESGSRLPLRPFGTYSDSASPSYTAFYDEKGYLLLTLGLAQLSGDVRMINALALQSVLSAICAVLLYLATFSLFRSEPIALMAAAVYAFHPLEIMWSATPDHPIWPVYATVVGVFALSRDWSSVPTARRAAELLIVGGFLYFCVVQRATVISVFSLVAVVLLWNWNRVQRWGMAAFVAGTLLVYVSVSAVPLEGPTIGRSVIYHTLLAGLGEFGAIEGIGWEDSEILDYIQTRYDVEFASPAFDEAFKTEYFATVSERPWLPVTTVGNRLGTLLLGFRAGRNSAAIVIVFGLFKLFTIIGFSRWWRHARDTQTTPIMLSCVGVILSSIVIHVLIVPPLLVYIAPALILLTPVAVAGAWECLERVLPRAKRLRSF